MQTRSARAEDCQRIEAIANDSLRSFFSVYTADDHDEPYGYLCSQCASTDVTADGLDRLECGDCGNAYRVDEWDGSYL